MSEPRFPIQGDWSKAHWRLVPGCTIPWSVAERAWAVYDTKYRTGQTLERMYERGGFGRVECAWFLSGGAEDWTWPDPGDVALEGELPYGAMPNGVGGSCG